MIKFIYLQSEVYVELSRTANPLLLESVTPVIKDVSLVFDRMLDLPPRDSLWAFVSIRKG